MKRVFRFSAAAIVLLSMAAVTAAALSGLSHQPDFGYGVSSRDRFTGDRAGLRSADRFISQPLHTTFAADRSMQSRGKLR